MNEQNIQRYSTKSNARRALSKIGVHARAAHETLIKEDLNLQTFYFVTAEANRVQIEGERSERIAKHKEVISSGGKVKYAPNAKNAPAAPQAFAGTNAPVCLDNVRKMAPAAAQRGSIADTEQHLAAAPAASKAPKAEIRNGVRKPIKGVCADVWKALDEMQSLFPNGQPTIKDVRELVESNKWNLNNATIEFYAWRKFHKEI